MKNLETEIARLQREIDQYKALNKQLEAEIKRSEAELKRSEAELKRSEAEAAALRRTVAEAKDPSPVKRASLKRVQALAASSCLSLQRLRSGWLLKLGHLERRFRSLGQIWQILVQDDWALSDVFPPSAAFQQSPRLPFRHPVLAPAQNAQAYR